MIALAFKVLAALGALWLSLLIKDAVYLFRWHRGGSGTQGNRREAGQW